MIDNSAQNRPSSGPQGADRLDGWKRIMAYLNRDVRTLRRWEKNEGLPIHRLKHDKLATVYAYRSEIDTWLAQRGETPTATLSIRKRFLRWIGSTLALLAVIVGIVWFQADHEEMPKIAFGQWDWVLITQFENRTGEARLDGSVEYALQRELGNSPYVKVAPRERVNDALRLMKLPPDTPIDLATGREISLRDGGIRMLLTGRIDKLGQTYQISVELVSPSDGVSVASFSTEAEGPDRILPRIADLAAKVREGLGESISSIKASREQLAKVTTPSLEALRLYSDADQLMASTDRQRALPFLEQAVRIDPDFASAHLLLWYALSDRDEMERATRHLRRAMELADQTSERERLFIQATFDFDFLHDSAKAIETYRLLLRLYPDHYWANGNLANILESLGRLKEAYPYLLRNADWRPNLWFAQYDAVQFAIVGHDAESKAAYLARTAALPDKPPYLEAGLTMLPAFQAWVDGDYAAAARAADAVVASVGKEDLVREDDGWLFAQIRSMYLALGKLARFRQLSALRERKGWFDAVLDLDSGNAATLDEYLEGQDAGFWTATLLALAGHNERAEAALNDPRSANLLPAYFPLRAWKNLARGELALSEGRFEDAVKFLGSDNIMLNIAAKDSYLFAMHSLAQAYEGLGQTDKASRVLQAAALQKPLSIFQPGATLMWLRNQVYLAQLLTEEGQLQAATDVENELRNVLQLADSDYPYLHSLQ